MTKRKCLRVKLLVLLPQPLHVLRERRAARPAQLLDLDQAVKAAKDRPAKKGGWCGKPIILKQYEAV